jgi:hypothetical protein
VGSDGLVGETEGLFVSARAASEAELLQEIFAREQDGLAG